MREELMRVKHELCEQIIEMGERGVNKGNIEPIYMAAVAAEKIMKMQALEGEMEDGYSQRGRRYSRDDGMYPADREHYDRYRNDSYDGGESYARRGEHYVRGHYSREDGTHDMATVAERMMNETRDPKEKEAYRKLLDQVR